MSRVIHFEIPSDDPARARRFYERAFGWTFQSWGGPMEYWLATTGKDGPGIDGGLLPRQAPGQTVSCTLGVASVDESLRAVQAAGGAVTVPKSAIPGVGWLAYFADPEGNVIGLMQADPAAK